MALCRSFLFSSCVLISVDVLVYLFGFASIAFALANSVITVCCALFNELERFSSWCCHRCYPHVFNQQPTNKSKEMKREKTAQNHTNAMRIYLWICVMHFLWFFPLSSISTFLVVGDDEYSSSIAAASQLFPFFLCLMCVCVFLHFCFFSWSLVVKWNIS